MEVAVICPACGTGVPMDALHRAAGVRFDAEVEETPAEAPTREYRRVFADVAGEFESAGCAALLADDRRCS